MAQQLQGKRVAILATHGFEESELAVPRAALQQAGVEVHIVSPQAGGHVRAAGGDVALARLLLLGRREVHTPRARHAHPLRLSAGI